MAESRTTRVRMLTDIAGHDEAGREVYLKTGDVVTLSTTLARAYLTEPAHAPRAEAVAEAGSSEIRTREKR